jgi:hypothetical protein
MQKILLIAVGVIALLGAGLSLVLHFDRLCGEELMSEQTSPDGRHVAALMIRNCGATTDYASHINVRSNGSSFHRGFFDGTITDGEILTAAGAGPVRYCWLAAKRLNLDIQDRKKVRRTSLVWQDVDVTYGSNCP